MEWYDVLPYKRPEPGADGIKALLDHVGRFVMVIHRDASGRTGITVAAERRASAPVLTLDGMDVVLGEKFGFGRYHSYRRYLHRRHCAVPIADGDTHVKSVYDILGREVSGPAFLCANVRRTQSMSRVYEYIRCMEDGTPAEGILHMAPFLASKSPRVSASRQGRIQAAKSKIARRAHLFSCEILSGAGSLRDIHSIESVFPHGAFAPHRVTGAKSAALATRNPSPPLLRKTRHPLLSETELLSFLRFPTADDLLKTGLKHGKATSYTSGARITGMKSTVE